MTTNGAVTPSVQDLNALNAGSLALTVNTLAANYNGANQIGVTFFELPAEVQTVLTDVAFPNGPNLSRSAPTFWSHMTSGNFLGAYNELLNWNGPGIPTGQRYADNAVLLRRAYEAGALPLNASQGRCP